METKGENKPRRAHGTGRVFRMKGGDIWWIQYYVNGRQVRESSGGNNERVAEKLLRQRLGQKAAGIHPELRRLTYDDLRDAYMDYYVTNKKKSLRWRKDKTGELRPCLDTVTRLDAFFRGYRATAITRDLMVTFRKQLQSEGSSDSTINRSLSALRRMFRLAKQDDKLRHVPSFPMVSEDACVRKGVLPQDSYPRLRDALPDYLKVPLALGYHAGMRLGEIRGLRWEQVNFLDGFIRLNAGETKNNEAREIPIGTELGALLKEQYTRAAREKSPWVCFRMTREGNAVRLGDIRKAWQARCVKLGLGRMEGERYVGLIFHDLRRTFVTDAEHGGAPRHEVMKITGHKTESVYRRYAIENRERGRAALSEIKRYRAERKGAETGRIDADGEPAQRVVN